MEYCGLDWFDSDRDKWKYLVNGVINLQVCLRYWEVPSGCTTHGFSSGD
jgi:hypothetical protein